MVSTASRLKIVRTLSPSIDVAEVLAERALEPDAVELVADMWYDRDRYLAIYDSGRVPTIEDARIDESELAERLRSDDSMAAIAALDESEFEAVLTRSIEEWIPPRIPRSRGSSVTRPMGHHGCRVVRAQARRLRRCTGPAIVERRGKRNVLLTTSTSSRVSGAPLLATFAPEVAPAITTRTVDSPWRDRRRGRR